MEYRLNTIKADLYKVFVDGNANNIQIARVFVLFAFPVMSAVLLALR